MSDQTLELLKVNLGIMSKNRDTYLSTIIESVVNELQTEQGISIDLDNELHVMFIVDYSAWRYRSRGEGILPRNLQFRLHNLVLSEKENKNG
ncbi:phage head-tail connector protein [Enterococcus faecalis]|uniref:phage head-tail connector protein n=1 Tax=Enterococcus TaxID=1350 RepID=UPI00177B93B8|nr:phage head-tail connector protein [Enterococcus faecalis]MBD9927409.1 phage head-tail connector protein [Enterococcus faecalis]